MRPLFLIMITCLFALQMLAQSATSIANDEKDIAELKEKIEKLKNQSQDEQAEIDRIQSEIEAEVEAQKQQAEAEKAAGRKESHGVNQKLTDLRQKLKSAKTAKASTEQELEKLKEKLAEKERKLADDKQKFDEKQEKELEKFLKRYPLKDDIDDLKKLLKEIDGWSKGDWKTPKGKDLKERLKKKIKEKIDRLRDESSASFYDPKGEAITHTPERRFTVGATTAFELTGHEYPVEPALLMQHIYEKPEFLAQLQEQQGKFELIDAPEIATKQYRHAFAGVQGQYRLTPVWSLDVGADMSKTEVQTSFSVPIIRFSEDPSSDGATITEALQGRVTSEFSTLRLSFGVNRTFLPRHKLQPIVGVGASWWRQGTTQQNADLEGLVLGLQKTSPESDFGVWGRAGLQFFPARYLQLQIAYRYDYYPDGQSHAFAEFRAGFNF